MAKYLRIMSPMRTEKSLALKKFVKNILKLRMGKSYHFEEEQETTRNTT